MGRSLFQELVDWSIDFLHADESSLRTCSLVCRDWLPACRYHLWFTVLLAVSERTIRTDTFSDFLKTSPHLCAYIALLRIDSASPRDQSWSGVGETERLENTIFPILQATQKLREIVFSGGISDRTVQLFHRPQLFPRLTSTTSLRFLACDFGTFADFSGMFSAFPKAKSLQIQDMEVMMPPFEHIRVPMERESTLKAFYFTIYQANENSSGLPIQWLIDNALFTRLEILSLIQVFNPLPMFQQLAPCVARTLRSLYLFFTYHLFLPPLREDFEDTYFDSLRQCSSLQRLDITFSNGGDISWLTLIAPNITSTKLKHVGIGIVDLSVDNPLDFVDWKEFCQGYETHALKSADVVIWMELADVEEQDEVKASITEIFKDNNSRIRMVDSPGEARKVV